jgi:acyl-CoA-binding protein
VSAPKRTEFEREAQLVEIKDAYLRGDTQMGIAARLGLSQSQISRDLAKIQRRWRESSLVDINEAKQRELERIDVLEREYWQAWENSKGEQQRSTASKTGELSRAQIVKYESAGDPRFLAGVQWCVEQRCKILGLLAAVKSDLNAAIIGPVQFVFDKWPE